MITIAIDGPSGAGKGTLAKALSAHYDLAFLDTGLLFRATARKAFLQNIKCDEVTKVVAIAQSLNADDFAPEDELRTEQVGQMASKIAVIPEVRATLTTYAQNFAKTSGQAKHGAILDGRDIGTVICPDAPFKFFVTASPEVRAKRRVKELQNRGIRVIYDDILKEIKERDLRDSSRHESPLKPAEDSFLIDTSGLSSAQVVEMAISHIDATLAKHGRLLAGKPSNA